MSRKEALLDQETKPRRRERVRKKKVKEIKRPAIFSNVARFVIETIAQPGIYELIKGQNNLSLSLAIAKGVTLWQLNRRCFDQGHGRTTETISLSDGSRTAYLELNRGKIVGIGYADSCIVGGIAYEPVVSVKPLGQIVSEYRQEQAKKAA